MKRFLGVTLLILTAAATAQAQDSITTITWQISSPLRDTKDFIDKTNYRGVAFDLRSFVSRNVSVGGGVGWNVLDSGAVSETISLRTDDINGDITGTQFRYVNSAPFMAQVFYHIGDPDNTHGYVGTGVGMFYIRQRFEVGLFATEVSNWHFGLTPEVGVNIPAGGSSLNLALRYNYAAGAGQDLRGENFGVDYLTFNIGVSFFSGMF
jgi:hypothetical protein